MERTVNTWLSRVAAQAATTIERLLALAIIAGVIASGVAGVRSFPMVDWAKTETFYDLTYRVLLMVIGIEAARTLLTHDLEAILELLAFVVARKTLKPDVSSADIALSVAAFVALLGARRYFLRGELRGHRSRDGSDDGRDQPAAAGAPGDAGH